MSYDMEGVDLMNRMLEKHQELLTELTNMSYSISEPFRMKLTQDFLSDLANSLLDKTVFDIVKNLKDIQGMTERNLMEKRLQLIESQSAIKESVLIRHCDALNREFHVNPLNAEILRTRQLFELEKMESNHTEELNHLDMKIIMELDQTVSDQQITLEKVQVPGFFVSNKPDDIKFQMFLLGFIEELSQKEDQMKAVYPGL